MTTKNLPMPSQRISTETHYLPSFERRPEPAQAVSVRQLSSAPSTAPRESATDGVASTTWSGSVSPERVEELLANWARWCHGRLLSSERVVAELDYEAQGEEAQEARRQPNPVPPRDFDGLMVERMVIRLPVRERSVIQMDYVKCRRRRYETSDQWIDRKRRKLRMPRWQYEESLRLARQMVANLLRRHK
jgi:hypothetical protein